MVSPDGTKLYVGGGFSAIGGAPRVAAAELVASTGTATAFNPSQSGGNVVTVEITPDGSRFFYSTENNTIFAYDPAVSNDPVWQRKFSGNTQAMAAGPSGELYVGGHFSQDTTSKTKRAYFASIYYDTGALTPWDVAATGGKMGVWAFLVDGDKLHAGGAFNVLSVPRSSARTPGSPGPRSRPHGLTGRDRGGATPIPSRTAAGTVRPCRLSPRMGMALQGGRQYFRAAGTVWPA